MNILKNLVDNMKLSIFMCKISEYDIGQVQVTNSIHKKVYDSMISSLKVNINEIDLVADRIDYELDKVYPQYNDNNINYYVINNDKIYICLSNNNNSESKYPPTGTLLNNIVKADGYVWAYIGDVTAGEVGTSTKYIKIPDKVYNVNDIGSICRAEIYSNTTLNFDGIAVQYRIVGNGTGAIFDISKGGLGDVDYISCASGGVGYTDNDILLISDNFSGTGGSVLLDIVDGSVKLKSFTNGTGYDECSILIVGDGDGAELEYSTLNGTITNVSVADGGKDYTWAKAFVFSSNRAIVAKIVTLPMNGKGTDPAILMNANKIRIKKDIDTKTYPGYVYSGMQFDSIGIMDQYDTNVVGVLNTYVGESPINKTSEVKEVYALNKVNNISITDNNKVNLILTIKLDG